MLFDGTWWLDWPGSVEDLGTGGLGICLGIRMNSLFITRIRWRLHWMVEAIGNAGEAHTFQTPPPCIAE